MKNSNPTVPPTPAPVPASDAAAIPAKWSWHYEKLLELRGWLTHKREEREAAIRVAQVRGGADFGDTATKERENMEMLAKLSFSEAELAEVDAALDRIRQKTYGICEMTGQPIGAERLRALPWTRLSLNAAERVEKDAPPNRAPGS